MYDATLRRRLFEQVKCSKQARQQLAQRADDAVLFTGRMMMTAEPAAHSRSDPPDDVVVSLSGGFLAVRLEPPRDGQVGARLDPPLRLLTLWGRREPTVVIFLEPGADRDAL